MGSILTFNLEGKTKMTFTIIWRLENDGDFFEQSFKRKKSASLAVKMWRDVWGLHESDCVIFEVKKEGN